jgi:uncharacterized protein (DUF885 family)
MSEPILRYELDRYIGWPGQAASYKIGERYWLQLREQARASQGAAFDHKSFHRQVLDIGPVGLDVLRGAALDLDRSTGAPRTARPCPLIRDCTSGNVIQEPST